MLLRRRAQPFFGSRLDLTSEREGKDSAFASVAAAPITKAKSGDFLKFRSFEAEDASDAMVNPLSVFDAVGAATSSAGPPNYVMESIAAPLALVVGGAVVAARGK